MERFNEFDRVRFRPEVVASLWKQREKRKLWSKRCGSVRGSNANSVYVVWDGNKWPRQEPIGALEKVSGVVGG